MTATVLGSAVVAAVVVATVVAAAGGVLVAEVRAQDAADAAALAAVHAPASPHAAAAVAAAAGGAEVVRCGCSGATVHVTVRAPVPGAAARLAGISHRRATAAARLVRPGGG